MDKSDIKIVNSWFNPASLSASMANEINSPLQFIESNSQFIESSFYGLSELFALYEKLEIETISGGNCKKTLKQISEVRKKEDVDFSLEQIPIALLQTREGIKKVAEVIRVVKQISSLDDEEVSHSDVHSVINYAILNSRSSWKKSMDVFTEFESRIDPMTNRIRVLALAISKIITIFSESEYVLTHKKIGINISTKELNETFNIIITSPFELSKELLKSEPVKSIKSFCGANVTLNIGDESSFVISIPKHL